MLSAEDTTNPTTNLGFKLLSSNLAFQKLLKDFHPKAEILVMDKQVFYFFFGPAE